MSVEEPRGDSHWGGSGLGSMETDAKMLRCGVDV